MPPPTVLSLPYPFLLLALVRCSSLATLPTLVLLRRSPSPPPRPDPARSKALAVGSTAPGTRGRHLHLVAGDGRRRQMLRLRRRPTHHGPLLPGAAGLRIRWQSPQHVCSALPIRGTAEIPTRCVPTVRLRGGGVPHPVATSTTPTPREGPDPVATSSTPTWRGEGSGSGVYNQYSVPPPYSSPTASHLGFSGLNLNANSFPHMNDYEGILRFGEQQGEGGADADVDVAPVARPRRRASRARGVRRGSINNNPQVPVHLLHSLIFHVVCLCLWQCVSCAMSSLFSFLPCMLVPCLLVQ
jgi:hypothetical protein